MEAISTKVEGEGRTFPLFHMQVLDPMRFVPMTNTRVGKYFQIKEDKPMNLVKCPRCDLNYIREDEKYCKVCLQEMKGESRSDEIELCSICNEEPALPGKDVCLFCLREMNKSNSAEENEPDTETENVDTATIGDMDDVSGMDEIIPEVEEEETDEYEEIDQEMSLEDVREDEERDAEDEEDEEV